jgi:two-component system, cell cycle sensor histidine kinase and response regulator CckA
VNMDGMLRRLISADVELSTLPDANLGWVDGNAAQLEQVIANLVVNARDAMPNGGKLLIETGNVLLDDAYVREHPAVSPGRYVMLAISDTGIGMTDEVKRHIFEPFFTTKPAGKGTGLGLSTVFGIVKQHGGHPLIYSELGHGTVIKILLPRVEDPVASLTRPEVASEPSGGSETILVAEDDAIVRSLVVRSLRRLGYRVLESGNGEEALRVATLHDGVIDLLFTDVVMPQMGGAELVEWLRTSRAGVKVLFTTGYLDDPAAGEEVASGRAQLLPKPFTATQMAHKVREVLDARGTDACG